MSEQIKRIRVTLLLALLLIAGGVSAQTVKVTVKDSNGETVIGANVLEKGTRNGGVTDIDGVCNIKVSGQNPIVVSYIGMKSKTVDVKGKTAVNVVLEDEASSLNDLVVIGYGSVRKKDLTGSVSTVKGSDLVKVPVANVSEALTGKMAGVHVTTTDGSPDAEILIRVRGGGSITGDNSPLYVVDGFQTSTISDISPNDIEDITVLKDASATAIYGAEGANGVVLITTKNAKGGKTVVNYNGYLQTKTVANRMDAMNTYDYVMSNYEYALLRNDASTLNSFYRQFGVYDDLQLYKGIEAIDWQEDMFGADVLSQSHNVSISGGSDKTKFSLSGTYDYNGGLMENNDFSRAAFMFKLDHQINKKMKFTMNARVSDQEVNGSGTQGGTYKIRTSQAITSVATKGLSEYITPDFDTMSDEEIDEWEKSNMSLSEQAKRYWRRRDQRRFNFNAAFDWEIIKGLKARVEGGYGYGFEETKSWWGSTTTNASYVGGMPLAEWTKQNRRSLRETATISYGRKFLKDHKFDVMIGQEYRNEMSDYNYMYGTRYSEALSPEDVFSNFGMGSGVPTVKSVTDPDTRTVSFFGRLNYNYKERYLLTLTFREDGSSKFARGKQWGFFPAAAASWRIIEEPWIESTRGWLSNLKLRVSYGKVGNNRIANNTFRQVYSLNSGSKNYGVGDAQNNHLAASDVIANPNITWEKRTTRNIGLDFGFFKERLNGSLEFYWNSTDDLLIQHDITAPGYKSVYENSASTSNKGVELTLNAAIIQKKNFSLGAYFNIGFDKSNIDDLAAGINEMPFRSGWAGTDNKNQTDYIARVGEPIGLIYGWKNAGYYTTNDFESYDAATNTYKLKEGVADCSILGGRIGVRPGTMKLQDLNNDGTVDDKDITVIGDTNPSFSGGFGFNATIYDFDISANFTYTVGNDVYNATKIASTQRYRSGTYPNMLDIMSPSNAYSYVNPENGTLLTSLEDLAYWNEGGNGKGAKAMWSPFSCGDAVILPTEWAMEDASFLRLQSLTVGYTLPQSLTRKAYIQRLRVYVTATNLFCITGYDGYDPEVSSYARNSKYSGLTPGIDYSSYPKSRAFTFGINVTL